jgi:protein-S-isoprenylcysteine O-methyltransferase Ste14
LNNFDDPLAQGVDPITWTEAMTDTSLAKQAFEGLAKFLIALAALVFVPAWSLRYWQGWLFLLVFATAVTLITVHFLRTDPALIARRLRVGPAAEKETSQKRIQAFASFLFVALVAFPALDHRFNWSHLPPYLFLLGDGLIALGLLIVFLVFRENSFTSAIVEVNEEQRVISTGPYRFVRHPMYAGSLIFMAGIPIALGSSWGLLLCIPMAATLIWRLVEEERYLSLKLPGYSAYRTQTRFRLIPGVY